MYILVHGIVTLNRYPTQMKSISKDYLLTFGTIQGSMTRMGVFVRGYFIDVLLRFERFLK